MNFNPEMLKEQTQFMDELSLDKQVAKKQNESFIYDILEFNDIMHQIDVDEKINYYRSLCEYSNGNCTDLILQENIIESIRDAISKAFKAIADLIKKFINFITGKRNDETIKQASESAKEYKIATSDHVDPDSNLNKSKELKIFIIPDPKNINESYINGSLNNLTGLLDKLLRGDGISDPDSAIESATKMAYKMLSRSIARSRNTYSGSVTNSEEFRKCIEADSCYIESREMVVKEYLDQGFDKLSVNDAAIKEATKKLDVIKLTVERYDKNVQTKSVAMSPQNKEHAMKIITICKDIVNDTIWYFSKMTSMIVAHAKYCDRLYKSAKSEKVNESGLIHGEPFNGNTLFDNEDSRDFNRTEWLDLELTTECYELSSAILEYRRRVAVNEAIIFAEGGVGTYRKLVAMKEAEGQKLGDKFMQIINQIATAIDKFFSWLRDKISLDANYIKRNKKYIDMAFKMKSVTSTGDILSGLARIQKKLNVKPYDYNSMKDSLNDEKEFFKKYILEGLKPTTSKYRTNEWDGKKSITDFCKAYYGASMSKDDGYPECVYSKDDFEKSRNDIVNFLKAPNSLMAGIRAEINNLRSEAKKAATTENTSNNTSQQNKTETNNKSDNSSEAPKNGNTTSEAPNENSNNQTNTNESMYYSELYQRWFTEVQTDFESDNNTKGDSSNKSEGDNSNKSEGNSSNKSDVKDSKSAFKAYLNVYKSVLLSKLTGASFVRTELMAVMKEHVKSYNPKAAAEDKQTSDSSANSQTNNTTSENSGEEQSANNG